MKIIGNYVRRVINEEGDLEVTFSVKGLVNHDQCKELKKDINYKLEIQEVKNKRTLEQNALLWELIHEIAVARGTERASEDDWEIYLEALEKAGVKFEYIAVLPEAEQLLKNRFRALKLMNTFEHKGKTFNQYKVYYGSSKLTTKEMSLLLDTVKDMASECGVVMLYE